ncbi:ATP-binding protein [Nonomuraea sp. NPDC049784]|uniref:ATP-binding protein n=1 Tax=Nonomuraea sp. NPDC049784 TaxID=3154361 RepID=UPI0033ED2A37
MCAEWGGEGLWPLLACEFTHAELPLLRHVVGVQAAQAGLVGVRWDDFVLAAHEGAVNAVGHGGGTGWIRMWRVDGLLCCEISDDGPGLPDAGSDLERPARPGLDGTGGRGLWLIRQLADEVAVSSGADGTRLRIAVRLTP